MVNNYNQDLKKIENNYKEDKERIYSQDKYNIQ